MKPITSNKENPMPYYIIVGLVALVAIVALLNGNMVSKNNYQNGDLAGHAFIGLGGNLVPNPTPPTFRTSSDDNEWQNQIPKNALINRQRVTTTPADPTGQKDDGYGGDYDGEVNTWDEEGNPIPPWESPYR